MNPNLQINIRCWQHKGSSPLEDLVLGIDERVVMDSSNTLSSDEFDACIAIVFCKTECNTYAHLAQVVGLYKGDPAIIWDVSPNQSSRNGQAYEIKPISHIHRIPDAVAMPLEDMGFAFSQRMAVMHYLLDMG